MTDAAQPEWPQVLVVDETAAGKRLDAYLAAQLDGYSRVAVQRAIGAGQVTVDGHDVKPSMHVEPGWTIRVAGIETVRPGPEPEEIPLDILYEDDWMAVVNKPAGMVVHPAKGHWSGTLASALAFRFGQLSTTGGPQRPGIVHRLDRDTTGVIAVARNDRSHEALAAQFKERTTEKEYWAIVRGVPDRDADVIDRPIGPHPKLREAMAIRPGHPDAREALTTFQVMERFERFSLLKVLPKTGRTHQIRVHLASIGLPILCDKLYGGSLRVNRGELLPKMAAYNERREGKDPSDAVILERQALHARRLSINHPGTGERMTFEAPLAKDFEQALECLRSA
ncbi:RluA family pseudouridine synthase [Aeoliella sp. ICT_H6.2]|uniref:Pseudouridine synthase n=1 Tax=Aeoliella straminimaris TaxID=2954799 RepID=A0A9X2FE11_9BACT|nr:RluA family pseudouridine synthase [Aeoliella straminimaris]MCO6044614.1 RluA family pseudouridine synthase [Aeoliella straminimaris]